MKERVMSTIKDAIMGATMMLVVMVGRVLGMREEDE